MRNVLIISFILCFNLSQAQTGFAFLGKTIGEAKVMSMRSKVSLMGDDSEIVNGVIQLTFKSTPSPKGTVALGLNYTLMFDNTRGDTCVQVVAFPTIQQAWVIDTIVDRLEKRFYFKPYDQTTWVRSARPFCSAHLEYVNALTAEGRKTQINLLRLTFKYYSSH